MMAQTRSFFAQKNVLEVDTPLLSLFAPIDVHIDVMSVVFKDEEKGFLHTSPEYAMKRLLSMGIGDIYQLSHVFRKGEIGPLHNPEFTMVEWYRLGISLEEMIEETIAFIRLFLSDLPHRIWSYREILKHYLSLDYLTATPYQLVTLAQHHDLHLPSDAHEWDKDTLLQALMSFLIEPHLGKNELTVIRDYPATQAALAQTLINGNEPIAKRFEVYYQGIELANGYHELADSEEQRKRFEEANKKRVEIGKEALKIDEHFLQALSPSFPDCCGVAVGFDRLMLLRHRAFSLSEVFPFSFSV